MQKLEKICNGNLDHSQDGSLAQAEAILREGLFSIDPACGKLEKGHLRLLSTPGVADVCLRLHKNKNQVNDLTIRGKSVALVSCEGNLMQCSGDRIYPVMDWFVAQFKYYANVDAYPFILPKNCNFLQCLGDLANSYSGALLLDFEIDQQIPVTQGLSFSVLEHQKVIDLFRSVKTEAQISSYILCNAICEEYNGKIPEKLIRQWSSTCHLETDVQRYLDLSTNPDPITAHRMLKGKIGVNIHIDNFNLAKKYLTLQNLKKLTQNSETCSVSKKLNLIITDGTAVLGLGSLGPIPALTVMQAKCMVFKALGNVNMLPVCINQRSSAEETLKSISAFCKYFKATNLEDISAPSCFFIERKLQQIQISPIFHDDQHGTAVAVLAGILSSLKLCQKKSKQCQYLINGAGAAGLSIARILHNYGIPKNKITICDSLGVIHQNRVNGMNSYKKQVAAFCQGNIDKNTLQQCVNGIDVFIGVSAKNTFKKQWIQFMAQKPIIFALANPQPEITREQALQGGAYIYGSGVSGSPNQISNSLVYPGVFAALNTLNLKKITPEMEIQVAEEIASMMENTAKRQCILPHCLDPRLRTRIVERLRKFSLD